MVSNVITIIIIIITIIIIDYILIKTISSNIYLKRYNQPSTTCIYTYQANIDVCHLSHTTKPD